MKQILKSERLQLRAIELADAECIFQWENDSTDWEYGSTMAPYSHRQIEEYIKNNQSDLFIDRQLRLLAQTHDGNKVGLVDLFNFDPFHSRAYVGVYIDKEYRGKGYAVEACKLMIEYARDFMGMHQLVAEVVVSNTASIALFKQLGFEQTGVLRQWHRVGGEYRDVLILQLLFF